jgi:hypothetical protein
VLKKKFVDKVDEPISDSSFRQLKMNSFYMRDYMSKQIQKTFDEIVTRKSNFFDGLMKKIFILNA